MDIPGDFLFFFFCFANFSCHFLPFLGKFVKVNSQIFRRRPWRTWSSTASLKISATGKGVPSFGFRSASHA